jgi:hypothetical protein
MLRPSGRLLSCGLVRTKMSSACFLWIVQKHAKTIHHAKILQEAALFFQHIVATMKFLSFAALLATASAFTTSPVAFSSITQEKSLNNVFTAAPAESHRTRRATIVMDGKANGE